MTWRLNTTAFSPWCSVSRLSDNRHPAGADTAKPVGCAVHHVDHGPR